MMTLLPVLLLRGRQNVIDHQVHEDERRARIENFWLQRPGAGDGHRRRAVRAGVRRRRKVNFDYNLIKLQSPSLSSVVFEQKLTHSADKSAAFRRRRRRRIPDQRDGAGGKNRASCQRRGRRRTAAGHAQGFSRAEPELQNWN